MDEMRKYQVLNIKESQGIRDKNSYGYEVNAIDRNGKFYHFQCYGNITRWTNGHVRFSYGVCNMGNSWQESIRSEFCSTENERIYIIKEAIEYWTL